ncbi:MAG: CocE/NonD family hydrolase [Thermoleophilia bacterium]|nr:CocE/NonD family hydrolase [Thermoleophilia bacterium]
MRLAARVWLPVDAQEAPVPAILEYLPYRKSDGTALADARRHPYFAAHAYAAVRVDLRGTGDSDGLLRGEYLPQEQDDALEVLAWLAEQPWCSGRVGMIGYSWGGFNGLQVAARRPSQLKAVITVASTDDRYLDDCHYMGGCLLGSDMLKWASTMLAYTLQPPDPRFVGDCWRKMWLERLERAPELAGDWVSHQLRDDFWRHGSVAEDYSAIECPVMVVGGWADAYTNAVPRLLESLTTPRLAIIGPWGHMMPHEGVPGPTVDFLCEAVRWWDHWLKGIDTGIMAEPRLRVWLQDYVAPAGFHAMRPGRWIARDSWPPAQMRPSRFVLRPGGTLAADTAAMTPGSRPVLGQAIPADVDLGEAPTASFLGRQECGECAGVWCANGYPDEIAGDQSPDDLRSLCFTTPPLDAPLDVLGRPRVRLRLTVDRPSALVSVRVEDVAPEGSSLLVSWSEFNLTHRDGHERALPLEPGREYDVEVESRVCGHRFPAGHRIRLALSPTYWPHAWPSPEAVTLTVVLGGASVLELPIDREGVTGNDGETDRVSTETAAWCDRALSAARASAPVTPQAAHDRRVRVIEVDERSRRHVIVDREEHARVIPTTGVLYTELATDLYSIIEDDPLSATVRCTRETRSDGGSTAWRVTVASEMTCDEHRFRIRECYAAYEGEGLVFSSSRSNEIGRLLV